MDQKVPHRAHVSCLRFCEATNNDESCSLSIRRYIEQLGKGYSSPKSDFSWLMIEQKREGQVRVAFFKPDRHGAVADLGKESYWVGAGVGNGSGEARHKKVSYLHGIGNFPGIYTIFAANTWAFATNTWAFAANTFCSGMGFEKRQVAGVCTPSLCGMGNMIISCKRFLITAQL